MCRAIVENVLSGTKAGFKATRNLVFNQKAERSTMNRQKSRGIVENLLSGTKAGFKAILNFEHSIERKKMDHQKSKSTFSAILLALILGLIVLWTGPAAAQKEYVTDPSNGKVWTAPQYGGTLTYVKKHDTEQTDAYVNFRALGITSTVVEKLSIVDWAIDRDKYAFVGGYVSPVSVLRGALAESWEQSDPTTFIFHIRQGVRWHDKPPVSGRELTAKDVEHSFHRYLGLGSGFTEPSPMGGSLTALPFESVEATDKWTVVIKLKEPRLEALPNILDWAGMAIQPPEVIAQYGDMKDWRNLVGTGPYMITDRVEGTSWTHTRNPNYWGTDEKYPENRLPYIDKLETVITPEVATMLAGLRSAKIDYIGWQGAAQLNALDQALSLQRTNPELVVVPWSERSNTATLMNPTKPPFNDIRVRHAMQMALDLETMNNTYYKGHADTIPRGKIGRELKGYHVPFEEWSDELKGYYIYNKEGAEKLLDEAGYPRGADGIRFKTTYTHFERYDLSMTEFMAAYWREIGVVVDIKTTTAAQYVAAQEAGDFELTSTEAGAKVAPSGQMGYFWSGWYRNAIINDPQYEAWYKEMQDATTVEEQMPPIKNMDMMVIEQHWMTWGSLPPAYNVHQPWVKGYSGEGGMGAMQNLPVFARLWIDSDLKEEMGH